MTSVERYLKVVTKPLSRQKTSETSGKDITDIDSSTRDLQQLPGPFSFEYETKEDVIGSGFSFEEYKTCIVHFFIWILNWPVRVNGRERQRVPYMKFWVSFNAYDS